MIRKTLEKITIKPDEIAIGKSIKGEIVVSNEGNRISTITNGYKNYYSVNDNTLTKVNSVQIPASVYNMYLNSINKIN